MSIDIDRSKFGPRDPMSGPRMARPAREEETREAQGTPKTWLPPQSLPDPEPQEGYTYRWIRVSTLGMLDNRNVSNKLREGWEPVKRSDHPEIRMVNDRNAAFGDNIEIGGLVLCKAPIEMVKQRNEHYRKVADAQLRAVDNNYMREQDPRMPMLPSERKTRVSFGSGLKP